MTRTLILSLMTLLLSAAGSFACSCNSYDTLGDFIEADGRDTIFIAEVLAVEDKYDIGMAAENIPPGVSHRATIRPLQGFRGDLVGLNEIWFSNVDGNTCGVQFFRGDIELFAPYLRDDGLYIVHGCSLPPDFEKKDFYRYFFLGEDTESRLIQKQKEFKLPVEGGSPE